MQEKRETAAPSRATHAIWLTSALLWVGMGITLWLFTGRQTPESDLTAVSEPVIVVVPSPREAHEIPIVVVERPANTEAADDDVADDHEWR